MYKRGVLGLLLLTPGVASAQLAVSSNAGPFQDLLVNFLTFTNDTLIPFILGLGFFFFVWGVFRYFIFGGANEESTAKGKSLIIYATLGFVVILVFWGVVNMISGSTGLVDDTLNNIPTIDFTAGS